MIHALLNLLNNSFDAVQSLSEKWVSISVVQHANRVEIRVEDSGRGIPADIAEKMMQPFFTTKKTGQSMGLSLAVSFGIIEAHGGHLRFDGEKTNTNFVILLPNPIKLAA